MAIFKALTFDGVNSLDYGIYITGEAVYNAPERAVEMVNIPGKNGALALDQGRFENIEVTYHAGCFADSQADFADKVMKFRNALASRYTYKRLTDEYHPDEYRLGLYKSGLEVDAVRYSTAGEFNITFDCKPQRFLVDGDRAISPTEWSDIQTESGELVTIDSDGSLAVKSLEVSLSPIQAGSGEPSPSNVRPISGRTEVVTQRTGKNVWDEEWESGVYSTSTGEKVANANYIRNKNIIKVIPNATYYLNVPSADNETVLMYYDANNNYTTQRISKTSSDTFTIPPDIHGLNFYTKESTYNNDISINYPSTDTEHHPYQGDTYTTSLGRTVYGGTLDVVSGELVVDRVMADLGTLNWARTSSGLFFTESLRNLIKKPSSSTIVATWVISSMYTVINSNDITGPKGTNPSPNGVMAVNPQGTLYFNNTSYTDTTSFKTAMQGAQLCYELATPQTYQLTPQQIDLLLGTNNVWSDGEITVEYGTHPYYNPTQFESKPLIKVTGTGTLGIGEYILTITGTASQTFYIDCETMEIYTLEGTVPTGASSFVSINKNDFPVLEPGTNYISVGSGITAVTITPRWWRI